MRRAPVVIRPRGGLGNQLFLWAAGRELADRLDAPLGADMSVTTQDPARRYELDSFAAGIGTLHRWQWPLLLPGRTFREQSFRYDPRFAQITRPTILLGYYQSWRYAQRILANLVSDLRQITSPSPWFAKMNADLDALARPPVVVHVRGGDYLDPHIRRLHGLLPEQYYANALDMTPAAPVWVFSDDLDEAQTRLRGLAIDRFVVAPQRSRAIESLLLMGRGSAHVLANSSFSWWAATIARFGMCGPVVAPADWFADLQHDCTDLLWPDWQTIPSQGK